MTTNTCIILATDGTKMNALHYRKGNENSNKIIIHVHGMAGNFYENSFMEEIALQCQQIDCDYLCFNNRGHDYIADCEKVVNNISEFYSGGCAYEKFSDCVYDLSGVLNWANKEGYSDIYLEGHSSGANKIIYAFDKLDISETIKCKMKGIILISPCDDIGIYFSETDKAQRNKVMKVAERLISEGNGNTLMPMGTFFDYLLSAQTFSECFMEMSPLDMFPYRNGTISEKEIAKIEIPLLITFGNNGEFLLQDEEEINRIYEDSALVNYRISIIDGAGHNYRGFEKQLAIEIKNWIRQLR